MFADIDLKEIAELNSPDRSFLSIYLQGPRSVQTLDEKIRKLSRALNKGNVEKDEREYLEENYNLVRGYLKKNPLEHGSLCIFVCWVLDYFKAIPVSAPLNDCIWIDSSPYIRPLAELQDEYENVAVIVADNKKARIFTVTSAVAGSEEVIRGNVKNHVRKGGWSQQRYERRRDKQLLLYAREIVDALREIEREENISRILLVGSRETLQSIYENIPKELQQKVAQKITDLGKGEKAVSDDMFELFFEGERQSEQQLWDKIRAEYLRGGLGIIGIEEVFSKVKEGRIEKMIVNRDYKPMGIRCRDCETLSVTPQDSCAECGSESVFQVDAVNEIVELVEQQGGETDFVDTIPALTECGSIAALLRY